MKVKTLHTFSLSKKVFFFVILDFAIYFEHKLEHKSTRILPAFCCDEKPPTCFPIHHWGTNLHKHFHTENVDNILTESCCSLCSRCHTSTLLYPWLCFCFLKRCKKFLIKSKCFPEIPRYELIWADLSMCNKF